MKVVICLFCLSIILFLVTSCSPAKNLKLALPAFDKQGHRGARGLMPENTIAAMLKAVDLGVTTLEMDVVITKDKQVILSHEPFFNHDITTRADGNPINENEEKNYNIYQMTYEESKQFDIGLKPHPRFSQQQRLKATKPLLSDVLDSVVVHCEINNLPVPFFNIETKSKETTDNAYHPAPKEFVELLMQVLKRKELLPKTIIQSFDFRTLKIVHKRYPSVATAALIEDYDKSSVREHLQQLGFRPTIYSPAFSLVTPELINECHKNKMKIVPWTVNDKSKIEELKTMGVDGIISDYPDLFLNL